MVVRGVRRGGRHQSSIIGFRLETPLSEVLAPLISGVVAVIALVENLTVELKLLLAHDHPGKGPMDGWGGGSLNSCLLIGYIYMTSLTSPLLAVPSS